VELVGEELAAAAPELNDRSEELATAVVAATGLKLEKPSGKRDAGRPEQSKYLMFVSRMQARGLAELAIDAARTGAAVDGKQAKRVLKDQNSVDLALFGRMVADDVDLNVDASAQVAHAISVHEVANEFDYFTAVDDQKSGADDTEDAGAGMLGTVEFNSSTLYRYATVDVNRLCDNLGDAAAAGVATQAFLRAFVTSLPTGKQNTFANRTLPDAVVVRLRSDQPVSLVGAFEDALRDTGQGWVREAAESLASYAKDVDDAFAAPAGQTWVVGVGDRVSSLDQLGDRVSLDVLVRVVGEAVADRLQVSR
jgi:CRISPR system Cascade subunit CasC